MSQPRNNSAFKPIKKVDLTLEVVERIKKMMQRGQLVPGSKLPPERELAQLLQVSRPSVRQALKSLSFIGLISSRPGIGTHITDSAGEVLSRPLEFLPLLRNLPLAELFEARVLIEVKLAALAARRATDDEIAAMREALDACAHSVDDPKKFVSHEIRFHKVLDAAAGNSVLEQAMEMLFKLLYQLRLQAVSAVEDLDTMLQYHERIYDAIVARDEQAAYRAMEQHFEYTEGLLRKKGMLAGPQDELITSSVSSQ